MKSLALDRYGDLVFPMRFVYDTDAVVQLIITKILKLYDEDIFALETGVDYFGVMMNAKATNELREIEVRKAIMSVKEVTSITQLKVDFPGSDGMVSISFMADTIFGSTGLVNT
jgi:hypothetical protein